MKYLQIRPGFSIKKDEIVGVEDGSDGTNGYVSNIYMRNGKVHRTGMPYKGLLELLEKDDLLGVNKFTQHNAG